MAYHSFISTLKKFIYAIPQPRILEIGVDRGTTMVPLVVFLSRTKDAFQMMGIDVMFQESLLITMAHIDREQNQRVDLVQANSLDALPKMVEAGLKFDLILVDGDHNYHTVTKELSYLDQLVEKHSLVVIDDYNGRWADRDLFYAERPEYAECKDATQRVDTDKHGVHAAVEDFLAASSDWAALLRDEQMDFVVIKKAEVANGSVSSL